MEDLRTRALRNLINRRNALSLQYDQILSEPMSYSIVGSVSATNRKLDELRKEIQTCDDKISALVGKGGIAGMQIRIPDYRCPYEYFTGELN